MLDALGKTLSCGYDPNCLPCGVDLNIAGPRESESKGAYSDVLRLLNRVIKQ